jgi:hypothetical protein
VDDSPGLTVLAAALFAAGAFALLAAALSSPEERRGVVGRLRRQKKAS